METDIQFGKLFYENPRMLADLLGLAHSEDYTACSQEFKDIKRTADIVWRSEKHDEQIIIEFQGYFDETIFHRAELERVMLSLQDVRKTVRMIVVFLDPSFHPHTQPWSGYIKTGHPLYEVVYLGDALACLEAKSPHHPLVQTLSPIFINKDRELKRMALAKYKAIQQSALSKAEKQSLTEIFLNLLASRFGNVVMEEMKKMIAPLMRVRDTTAGKVIYAEGETRAKIEAAKEQIGWMREDIEALDGLFEKENLPEGLFRSHRALLEKRKANKQKELTELNNFLAELPLPDNT